MAKEIYFVRHGITEANEAATVQGFDDRLSERGKAQAEFLADRLSRVSFDKLLASDMVRTRQTAEIVAAKTGHAPEFSSLFREIQYPASLIGLSRLDPRVAAFWDGIDDRARNGNDAGKHEDEESVAELIVRIKKGFDYAASRAEDSVVVVTHGNFLRKLVLILLVGEKDAAKYWSERDTLLATANTGVTLFRQGENGDWRLITWNDHAHLG